VVLAAAAIDAEKAGDEDAALSRALEAVGLAPSLIPAAILAARKLAKNGRTWKAQDVVEAAWLQAPHPDLASAYAAIHPNDDPAARARRMKALVQLNPNHVESHLVAAEQAIAQGQWFDARTALEPLTRGFPTTRACVLMAEIAQAERADVTAAQGWLARAARSPRDAQWRCGHCGFVMQDWSAICSNCDAFDSLTWEAPRSGAIEAMPPDISRAATAQVQLGGDKISSAKLIEAKDMRSAAGSEYQRDRFASSQRPPDDPGVIEGHLADSMTGSRDQYGDEYGEAVNAFVENDSDKKDNASSSNA
jgi:HemY protein